MPTLEQLEAELKRETNRKWHKKSADEKHKEDPSTPLMEQLEKELERDTTKKQYRRLLRSSFNADCCCGGRCTYLQPFSSHPTDLRFFHDANPGEWECCCCCEERNL